MTYTVAVIQELFPNYREAIFDRLNEHYRLIVIHGKRNSDLQIIEREYSICVFASYFFNQRFVFLPCVKHLKRSNVDVVIHQGSPGILSLPIVWFWCKINKVKFVIWTHGFERHQGFNPRSSFRSRLRLWYLKISDAVIFYTKTRKKFFHEYLNVNKLFYATNTLDTNHLLKIKEKLDKIGKEKLKKKLNMGGCTNLVFIGRVLREKLPLELLKVTLLLKNEGIAVKTHIIGNGEDLDNLVSFAEKYRLEQHVVFHGAIYDDYKSGEILFCSDLLVIPGYVGLAINHAYCFDLPVVTFKQGTEGPFHSPEIDYLKHNQNGLLIKSKNVSEMAVAIKKLVSDSNALNDLRANARQKLIEELTIEQMELGFISCIDYLMGEK